MSLQSKRVVIIGGTSGIGFAVARAALDEGADVVVASSQAANADAAAMALGPGSIAGDVVDVRDEASVEAFFGRAGAFDHLVFTAGDWGGRGARSLGETDLEQAKDLAAVRYWGAVAAIKHATKTISTHGSITLTNGMIAHRPRKGTPLSTAMAGSIEHLVRGLAVDLAPIRVNAVCPGLIHTGVWDSIPEADRQTQFERLTARQPIARIGEPEEAAEAYLYLMRGGYTTGQVLLVDGGSSVV